MTALDTSTWLQLWEQAQARTLPAPPPQVRSLWPAVLMVTVVVLVPPARRWARAVCTVVHEAGHAVVGLAVGRRFHGFTISKDLSGATVTSGPQTGLGRVLTSWAGYPAPAALGAVLALAALRGWAGVALAAVSVGLVLLVVMSRSLRTLALVVLLAGACGSLWWWGQMVPGLRPAVVAGTGLVLLLSAWDALADVARTRSGGQDHHTLARITPLPSWLWLGTWVVVCALCTGVVARAGAGLLW